MTLEERLDRIEARLGMKLPDLSHLSPEQIEDQKQRGLIPVGVGTAGAPIQPGEKPELAPGWSRIERSVAAMHQPDMSPAEALAHYGGRGVPMLFSEPVRLIDPDDHRFTKYAKGWSVVPEKHVPSLKGRAEAVPEEMRG